MKSILTNCFLFIKGSYWHVLLWSIAVLHLLLGPFFSYHFFVEDGKPLEVWHQMPEETGGIRYNVEDLKFWAEDMEVYEECETYALWGWAFLDLDRKVDLTDFDRFVVLSDNTRSYVFSTQIYPRPGVKEAFYDLGLDGLISAGFYAVISRNALPPGTYSVGLMFRQGRSGQQYYIETNKVLVRTPNHLKMNLRESNWENG